MAGFVIKELPEALHRKLREQAARHHRSMTKEVLALLEEALGAEAPQARAPAPFKGRFALTDKFLERARREGRE